MEDTEILIFVAYALALTLIVLTATCAKVCFSLIAEAEKQQAQAHVGELER
jgi:hypothetical protein